MAAGASGYWVAEGSAVPLNRLRRSARSPYIDPGNSGVAGEIRAAVSNGATTIASSGSDTADLRADLEGLFAAYAGDYDSAALIMHPRTALQISLLQQPLGDTDLKLTGGQLFGVPVATSRAVPWGTDGGSITLVDQSSIAYATGDYDVTQSNHAALEMDNVPTTASGPAGAVTETTLVGMFQTNTVAFLSTAHANWEVQGDGRVVVLVGVDY